MTVAITGANGHLGLRLVTTWVARSSPGAAAAHPGQQSTVGAEAQGGLDRGAGVRALVRSARAADQVRGVDPGAGVDVRTVDYRDPDGLAAALAGCTAVIHLVGIIKESRPGDYRHAHEDACAALTEAAGHAGLRRIVYLSILGASAQSPNRCLASRGVAEDVLRAGLVPVTVIRVPMVLGEHDYATRALAARARRRWNLVLRGASLEQPIYAGDVVAALLNALNDGGGTDEGRAASRNYELGGPESLSRAALIGRAAAVLGGDTRVVSLPLALGMALAWGLERVSSNPPVTRAMLGVLDHDDRIDPAPAAAALGVRLTPLDETLRHCLTAPSAP